MTALRIPSVINYPPRARRPRRPRGGHLLSLPPARSTEPLLLFASTEPWMCIDSRHIRKTRLPWPCHFPYSLQRHLHTFQQLDPVKNALTTSSDLSRRAFQDAFKGHNGNRETVLGSKSVRIKVSMLNGNDVGSWRALRTPNKAHFMSRDCRLGAQRNGWPTRNAFCTPTHLGPRKNDEEGFSPRPDQAGLGFSQSRRSAQSGVSLTVRSVTHVHGR